MRIKIPNRHLRGTREALHRKGKDYLDMVIDYLKAQNYILTSTSYIDGQTADAKFITPKKIITKALVRGRSDNIWVECKNSAVSLKTNNEFLIELGKYFLAFMNQKQTKRFELYIFVKKEKNRQYWDEVFDVHKQKRETKKELMLKIQDNLPDDLADIFKSYNYDDFDSFLNSITIFEGDTSDLEEEIKAIKKGKQPLNVDEDLLSETIQKSHDSVILTSNILKVKNFPEKIWIADIKENISKDIWNELEGDAYLFENKLYSLFPFDENNKATKYHDENSISVIYTNKVSYYNDYWENIFKFLIKHYIINRSKDLGCAFDKKLNCIYFKHKNINLNKQRIKTYNRLSRIVSSVYRDKETKEINFIRHDGIKINVCFIDNNFYVIFIYVRLFTEDGLNIIRGKRAKSLHYKFTRKWMFNNVERNIFQFWLDFLRLGQDYRVESVHSGKYLRENIFSFSKPLCINFEINFNYSNFNKPDENLEDEFEDHSLDLYMDEDKLEDEENF